MQILDWLRDGFFNKRTRYRRTDGVRPARPEKEEREDPSRHDFGRRAHHPDPRGHYEFGSDPAHRMVRPHERQI